MKKQIRAFITLMVFILTITAVLISCGETNTPTETTAAEIEVTEDSAETTVTPIVETTKESEGSKVPETIGSSETTMLPDTTKTPENTSVPKTTNTPETTNMPENTETPHVHVWNSWTIALNATCTTEGKRERSCACGEKETQTIESIGHTEVIDYAVSPTCTANGKTEGKHCFVCTTVLEEQETVKAMGHSFGEWKTTKSATCTNSGKQERSCTCGEKETLTINPIWHIWNEGTVTIEATCSKNGERKFECTLCGEIKKEQLDVTNIHIWNSGIITTEATCGNEGTRTYSCSVCSRIKTEQIQRTDNHAWDNGKDIVTVTAITDGETIYTCQICGKVKTLSIPQKGKIVNQKSYTNKNVFVDYSTNNGGDFSYCISTETPNVLGIEQEFQLKPNTIYIISVDVKTKNVISHENQFFSLGANISAEYLYNNSQGVLGDSDWTTISLIAKSNEKGILGVSLNLGYWYNMCSGTIWYDNLKITEYSDFLVEDPTWNFLFVVLTNTSLNTYDDNLNKQLNISHQMTNAEFEAICKSVDDFEYDLTKESKGVLKANATVIKYTAEISDYSKLGNDYHITAGTALKYLNEENININNYDHVFFITSFPDLPRSYFGLGGTFIKGYRGFSFIVYGDGATDCTKYCYDVSDSNWPAGLYLHEFIHAIESYATKFGFTVPSADGSGQYGYGTQNTDGWRKFYMDIILNQVEHNGTYTGVDPSIWKIPPRLFG